MTATSARDRDPLLERQKSRWRNAPIADGHAAIAEINYSYLQARQFLVESGPSVALCIVYPIGNSRPADAVGKGRVRAVDGENAERNSPERKWPVKLAKLSEGPKTPKKQAFTGLNSDQRNSA
jgi:hypothetical protein